MQSVATGLFVDCFSPSQAVCPTAHRISADNRRDMPNSSFKILIPLALAALLMACGGGNDADVDTVGFQDAPTRGVSSRPLGDASAITAADGTPGIQTSQNPEPKNTNPLYDGLPDIGMNLPMFTYYDTSFAFADLARHATVTEVVGGVGTDSNNAPLNDFTLMIDSRVQRIGIYKLSFNGKATVSYGGYGSGSVSNQSYDAETNTTTADVTIGAIVRGNKWLSFRNTQRTKNSAIGTGVTNIHLWRPGYPVDGSKLLTDEFKAAMRTVKILRAMDTIVVNRNTERTWGDRTPPTWIGRPANDKERGIVHGQAWETMIGIANELQRDIWINIPVNADNEYIRKVAQIFMYGSDGIEPYTSPQVNPVFPPLDPSLKLYIEWGNEIWNWASGFYGSTWATAISNEIGEDENHPANYIRKRPLSGGPGIIYVTSWKSAVISDIFRSVFGDEQMMARIRPVLCTQANNANSRTALMLTWAQAYYGDVYSRPVNSIWYAGCDAPYFGSDVPSDSTDPIVMSNWFDSVPTGNHAAAIRTTSTWMHGYGLKYITYEGGPEIGIGTSDANIMAYTRDPRIQKVMGRAYDIFKQAGGDGYVYYNYSGMGTSWAFIDTLNDDPYSATDTEKMKFLASIPSRPIVAPTIGHEIAPIVEVARDDPDIERRDSPGSPQYTGIQFSESTIAIIPIRIPVVKAGTYTIRVHTHNATTPGALLKLWVNGEYKGGFVPLSTSTSSKEPYEWSEPLTVNLSEGIAFLRLQGNPQLGHNVDGLSFELQK